MQIVACVVQFAAVSLECHLEWFSASRFNMLHIQRWYSAYFHFNKWLFKFYLSLAQISKHSDHSPLTSGIYKIFVPIKLLLI